VKSVKPRACKVDSPPRRGAARSTLLHKCIPEISGQSLKTIDVDDKQKQP